MRRSLIGISSLALGLVLAAAPANAQFFVAGGVTLPSGDFGDAYKAGWMANAGVSVKAFANGRANLWAEGLYGQNKVDGTSDAKSTIMGGLGSVTYNLTAGSTTTPYLIGAVGYLSQKISFNNTNTTEGGIGFGGGAGVSFNKIYIEGRYMTASLFDDVQTSFLMATVGILF
ncbi:MAG TPA: hypothetical protein VFN22_13845 [Gemmatimonadales bacterium]|nr:hypothetical protein [Gemmatimonadales bacterium]